MNKKKQREYIEKPSSLYLSDFISNSSKRNNICHYFSQGKECKWGDQCKFLHDVINNNQNNNHNHNENQSLTKERGKIFMINEEKGYGFIIPNNGRKKIFYHISEVEDNVILKEQDEVEYYVVTYNKPNYDVKAVKIHLLGKYSPTNNNNNNQNNYNNEMLSIPSLIPSWMKNNNNTKSLQVSSSGLLVAQNNKFHNKNILNENSTNIYKKDNIKIKEKLIEKDDLDGLEREKGIVQSVKDTFGFIRCYGKNGLVFYHNNEVEEHIHLHEGDEVDFYLIPDSRTGGKELKATRVRFLRSTDIFGSSILNGMEEKKNISDLTKFNDKRFVLEWLKDMLNKDGESLLLYRNELEQILNQDEIPFSIIQILLKLLIRPSIRTSEKTDKIYSIVLESKFMRHPRNLRSYILKISDILSKKNNHSQITNLVSDFQTIIDLIEEISDRFQNYSELPLDALSSAIQKIQDVLSDVMIEKINRLLNFREKKKTQIAQQFNTSEWIPKDEEEDFRNISIFPSTEEILSIPSGQLSEKIKPNIINGKYKNVMHYLDTHFRLLREDCLQPLREGINSYISIKEIEKKNRKIQNKIEISPDIRIYNEVTMKGLLCTKIGIIYRVSFKVDCEVFWERSKRLMYGSLICLSCDDFRTLLWATVANRDINLLYSSNQIDIRFPSGYEKNFTPDNIYTMVESSTTYFEAYQHVLRALQSLEIDHFPFVDYIINCKPNVAPPSYLKKKSEYNFIEVFDGGKLQFPILQKWPKNEIKSSLDDSQMSAIEQALTKELAIIQGPPGTGKTYVGLKVIRTLLNNKNFRKNSPILIICYTNHALDQFLEGILKFEENIVRIGGRSKSDILKDKNIRKLMYESGKTGKQHHRSRQDLNHQLDQLQEKIQHCIVELNNQQNLLTIDQLKEIIKPIHLSSLVGKCPKKNIHSKDILKFWLNSSYSCSIKKQNLKNEKYKLKDHINQELSIEEELGEEFDDEIIMEMQWDRMVGEDDFDNSNQNFYELKDVIINKNLTNVSEEILNCDNVWELNKTERYHLYRHWIVEYYHKKSGNQPQNDNLLTQFCEQYENLCIERRRLEEELQIEVLAKSSIIGMTTTGVAKFQKLIHSVQPEIIVVEEAAEVLEAHIIAALSPSTKHLILIGDHEQLRPSTAVYRLSIQYNLDVSLFERLVRNGVEQVTLLKQRRMRPSISSLISPIYPKLENHHCVMNYPHIKGVASDIFFLHHTSEEISNQDSASKSNLYEAEFITKLCNYLLLQGYTNDQITILTAYSGQVHLLRREFRKLNMSCRITSVDNFQGEENEIIILSLVRSNKDGIIGFLNASNRICVALSRAKIGMFIIGNGTILSQKNELWKKIINNFKSQNVFGTSLKLQCQNHPEKFTFVSKESDFKNVEDGGCNKPCEQLLHCGHICPRLCHPYSHDKLQCFKSCNKKHEKCNHRCTKRCFEECGNCEIKVEKKLPDCGHIIEVSCYMKVDEIICPKPCEKLILSCKKHKCPKLCGERCSKYCHEIVEKDLNCGHIIKMECNQDPSIIKCTFPCLAYLECGHKCLGECWTCKSGQHKLCVECLNT